ncbi:MAG TPA: RNase adapter RapZ [Gammaproteobacteria bacterium]|nr:RNase adapter RapZ [Gammaproteobacteria bacterium]OUX33006.1 MAG: RNase adaptor protein RapZ [Gammaproteobacteria bacterium TMED260]HCA36427.1 RNase adapter RapZ [Gammaproteobacteria bacterium]
MKLTIISGRSGSGKSTVLHVLEDKGYYCIDNLPASLLPALAKRISTDASDLTQVAVSVDARNVSTDLEQVPQIVAELKEKTIPTEILFLDANSQTLLKRFSESRRKHPLSSESVGLREAIDKESELLEPISVLANLTIDTSNMSLQALRQTVKERMLDDQTNAMALLFQSFGFKNGVPVDADIVYDVRCLPNPFWDNSLRALTGLDDAVKKFLGDEAEVSEMLEDISNYLEKWLHKFEANNRSYITVAVGCTGGQHRSVYLCERLAESFVGKISNVQVRHRELGV